MAFDPDVAPVHLDDMFDDGESEAGTALIAGAGTVGAEESLEDALLHFFGDAGSVVFDGDGDPLGRWVL